VKKTGNRTIITWVALLLALLFILPAPGVLASELSSSSVEESSQEESSSQLEEESSQLQEESSQEESQLPEGEVSSDVEDSSSAVESEETQDSAESSAPSEEGSTLEETEQETFEAYPLLVVGGHKAYMSGEPGAMFYPDRNMTRAEMAQVLYNLLASYPSVTENHFSDVSSSAWYAKAVNTLVELDVLSGYEDGTFRPSNYVTRAEFVTAVSKCFQMTSSGSSNFPDVNGHWAEKYINYASSQGWINGFEDGTFRPNDQILRCQVTAIMNNALDRTGDGFAADSNTQEFVDVPTSHWAFEHIAEAADPVDDGGEGEDPPSTDFQVGQTVRVTAEPSLRLREGPGTEFDAITTLATGTKVTVTSVESNGWLGVKTNGGLAGFVSGEYVVVDDGSSEGGGIASGASLSASSLTLSQYQSVRLDGSVKSNLSAMTWTSSDPSVAYVGYTVSYGGNSEGAMVYGAKPGTATITFADGEGTTKATCQVTVTSAQAVRFAYGDENIVGKDVKFNLIGITDSSRAGVKFTIVDGPANGSFETTTYTTESQNSSYGMPTNTVKVFTKEVSFYAAGEYTIRAYSKTSGGSWSSDYYEFTVMVTSSNVSPTTTTYDQRRASGNIISVLANFEGLVPEIEDDPIASGNPTVGYGYVVQKNNAFYNNLTEAEAYAQLVNMVNNAGYASAVENFRASNNIKMSQAQFDALVSFVYNLGPGVLNTSYDTFKVMLNATDPTGISSSNKATGTVNVVNVDTGVAQVYSDASLTSSPVTTLKSGSTVTIDTYKAYRSDTKQEVWYHVTTSDGKVGWVSAGYIRLSGNRACDLAWADSTVLANNFLQWNRSGGSIVAGLVYRRIAECNIFFYGDYAKAYHSSGYWGVNYYGYQFPENIKKYDSTQN
jgi:GH24 family phage-related lysozyme (muramidase)/uncharacterized protein YgiM (DUF1202 family)